MNGYMYRRIGHAGTWMVEGDTTTLRTGDAVEVRKKDGTSETRIVRRITKVDAVNGLFFPAAKGVPAVKHIDPNGANR